MRTLGITCVILFSLNLSCRSTNEGMSGRSGRRIPNSGNQQPNNDNGNGQTNGPNTPNPQDPGTQTPPPATGDNGGTTQPPANGVLQPRANFKVAYVGDQGLGSAPESVLNMIKQENVDLLMIPGDFDYKSDPDAWDKMLQSTVGNMPILAAMGNHDKSEWPGYETKLKARLTQMPKANCTGEVGVKQKCVYEGVVFAITAMNMSGSGHAQFIDETFNNTPALFKVCVWHYNQTKMQVGDKSDEAGWDGYETCRKHGAQIFTAHEHSYSRTHLMSDIKNQVVASTTSNLVLEPGKSFVTVTGLGGKSIRDQSRSDAWWAKIYTSKQNAKDGAVFCTYNVDNNPRKAKCVFKNVDGTIVDDYTVESKLQK